MARDEAGVTVVTDLRSNSNDDGDCETKLLSVAEDADDVPEDVMIPAAEEEEDDANGEENQKDVPAWLANVTKKHPLLVGGVAVGAGISTWYVVGSFNGHETLTNVLAVAGLLLLLICTVLLLIRQGKPKVVAVL